MKALILALALAAGSTLALAAPPAELVGDWKGDIDTPNGGLPVVFHVGERVLFDSPTQNALGFPATSGANGANWMLGVPGIGARFEGKLAPDGKSLVGTFYQGGGSMSLTLARTSATATLPPLSKPAPAALKGDWQGMAGNQTLLFHLGDVSTVDLVERGAAGIPANVDQAGDKWKLSFLGSVTFTGTLGADGKTLTGTLEQVGGSAGEVTLTRK